MVQVTADEIVCVIAVRDGLVPAIRTVLMSRFMAVTRMIGRAILRISVRNRQSVFVMVVFVRMMQVAVVQVVDMVAVPDRRMPTIRTVRMVVVFVGVSVVIAHGPSPSLNLLLSPCAGAHAVYAESTNPTVRQRLRGGRFGPEEEVIHMMVFSAAFHRLFKLYRNVFDAEVANGYLA